MTMEETFTAIDKCDKFIVTSDNGKKEFEDYKAAARYYTSELSSTKGYTELNGVCGIVGFNFFYRVGNAMV